MMRTRGALNRQLSLPISRPDRKVNVQLAAGKGAMVRIKAYVTRLWSVVAPSRLPGQGSIKTPAPARAAATIASAIEKESWRAVIDAMPDAALVLDSAGAIVHYNALMAEVFPNARVGQPLVAISRNPELNEAIELAVKGTGPVLASFAERVPVERRLSAAIARLDCGSGADASLPTLLVTFRDLTEQDRLAQMRADFIAHASHELRTPLAALRGFVETLQSSARDDPEARERFLAIMAHEARRMTRLIDDLLSLSRVEMRVHVLPRGVVDLGEVTAFVVQALDPVARASRIALKVERLDPPARIRGDREEIVQVFQNLVHNAIKYGREDGFVQIGIAREPVQDREPRRVTVAVRDNGIGIAPEHLPRLTERFYRINVASSRQKGGTGLGLAIVKHIVNRHRGELAIRSELGKGSVFAVIFAEL